MDLSATIFSSQDESNNGVCKTGMKNPFLDPFSDPFCKLNLKETESRGFSEISSQNGVIKRNFLEAPLTPGRPVFSFSNTRKCFPSKWDDAEKWLVSGTSSCNESPANNSNSYYSNNSNSSNSLALFKTLEASKMYSKQCSGYNKTHVSEIFAEKSRITEEKVSKVMMDHHHDHHASARAINGGVLSAPPVVHLKDKFPNELNLGGHSSSEPMQEKFLFGNTVPKKSPPQEENGVQHRDIGTEMTPLGSSTTSRCPTPFKSTSPARHNTPADRSGPLGPASPTDNDITQLQDCHLAKLHFGTQFDPVTSNWSSREEEEEDVSKSLRHYDSECRKSVSESKSSSKNCVWEEEEKTKSCLRYQREEAKIQAWVNLQSAKAEAESRKLEVKIQKMRANSEEKLMKRMADVHRKAEEWRATAQFQHSEQIRKAGQLAREATTRKNNNFTGHKKSCGCFPCNNK